MDDWKQYFDSEKQLATLAVAHRIRGVNEIVGSATYIGQGIFLTAKHVAEKAVIDAGMNRNLLDDPGARVNARFEVDLLHFLKNKQLLVWKMRKVHLLPNSDLAILTAQTAYAPIPRGDIAAFPRFEIDLHPPKLSSILTSYGYVGKTGAANIRLDGNKTSHTLALHEGFGPVEARYLFERFSSAQPPVVQVPYEILHSMSGGPAFNTSGNVVGINSAGLAPDTEDGSERSIVSMLWRAIVAHIEIPKGDEWEATSLVKLSQDGYITISGLEHFTFDEELERIEWRGDITCPDCEALTR